MLIGVQLQHENGNGEMKFTKRSSFCMNYSKTRADLKTNSNVRRRGEAMTDVNEWNVRALFQNLGTLAVIVKHPFGLLVLNCALHLDVQRNYIVFLIVCKG